MLPGNTGTAEGQAVILFKILRKLNRKTGTDGCVQMILLPIEMVYHVLKLVQNQS